MLRCGVNRSTLEISGRASKLRLFSGGKCGVQRQTPWAQVFIYRKRGADRAESRRAYRLARKRAEHGRLLSGHDEPVPYGDRKSTRLNSSHVEISYAGFCLK